jgi:hypothetical protein
MEYQNPWIAIWTKPRNTMAQIAAENPNQSLWILAAIYGFNSLMNLFQSIALGQAMTPMGILVLAILVAPFWGYINLSVWSWFVSFTGKWLKGQGNFTEVRSACAWSSVPLLVNIPLWLLMVALFGHQLFLNFPDAGILIAKIVTSIWSFIIYLNALAAVQKFSMLRTIGNLILAGIVLLALLIVFRTALGYFLGV